VASLETLAVMRAGKGCARKKGDRYAIGNMGRQKTYLIYRKRTCPPFFAKVTALFIRPAAGSQI
jgi:hypothetical protein